MTAFTFEHGTLGYPKRRCDLCGDDHVCVSRTCDWCSGRGCVLCDYIGKRRLHGETKRVIDIESTG